MQAKERGSAGSAHFSNIVNITIAVIGHFLQNATAITDMRATQCGSPRIEKSYSAL
jgi:hypothetical protein